MTCFLWTSFYGLNFGSHWDENGSKFDAIRETLRTGLFLQASTLTYEGGNYNHGGLNYLLTWSGLAPEVVTYLIRGPRTREAFSQAIGPALYTNAIRIRVRTIYVLLSSLAIVWLFCINLLLGRSRLEAFLAAAILAFSWEVAYHSRWVAPDAIMMQFGWLAFLCLQAGTTSRKLYWFYCGAFAIGLTMGSKYTGGLILPFFLVGGAYSLWQQRRSLADGVKHTIAWIATAVATFVLTTPGAVLDPFRFFYQVNVQSDIYATGWYGYTVTPGIPYAVAVVKYVGLQVFSHFWSISIVFSVFCVLGILAVLLERRLVTFLAAAFCFTYLAFFSQQSALIVRNLLVVVPFLALAAARGVILVAERCGRNLRAVFYTAIATLLAVNLGWEVYAARQVKVRFHPEYFLKQFDAYVEAATGDTFFVSTKLFNTLQSAGLRAHANVSIDPERPYTKVAFFQTEGPDKLWETWPGNAWGLYEREFGPLEVNLEAYSTFVGNERILVVTRDKFKKLPINDVRVLAP